MRSTPHSFEDDYYVRNALVAFITDQLALMPEASQPVSDSHHRNSDLTPSCPLQKSPKPFAQYALSSHGHHLLNKVFAKLQSVSIHKTVCFVARSTTRMQLIFYKDKSWCVVDHAGLRKFQRTDSLASYVSGTQQHDLQVVLCLEAYARSSHVHDNSLTHRLDLKQIQESNEWITDLTTITTAKIPGEAYQRRDNDGANLMHLAATVGNILLMEKLLNLKVDVNKPDAQGRTALMLASAEGHRQMVRLLLKHHTDPTRQTNDGATAAFYACQRGHLTTLQTLIAETSPELNLTTHTGVTAFFAACQAGHARIVNFFLRERLPLINVNQVISSSTALIEAVKFGHFNVVNALLKVDHLDINAYDAEGKSALHYAVYSRHMAIAKLLLSRETIDTNSSSTMHCATPLLIACQKGDIDMAKLLLKHPTCDVNRQDENGVSSLVIACMQGDLRFVEMLLAQPAIKIHPESFDTRCSALMAACWHGHDAVVARLLNCSVVRIGINHVGRLSTLDHGGGRHAKQALQIPDTLSAIDVATLSRNPCIIRLLEENGAIPSAILLTDTPDEQIPDAQKGHSDAKPPGDDTLSAASCQSDDNAEHCDTETPITKTFAQRANVNREPIFATPIDTDPAPMTVKRSKLTFSPEEYSQTTESFNDLYYHLTQCSTDAFLAKIAVADATTVNTTPIRTLGKTLLIIALLRGKSHAVEGLLKHPAIEPDKHTQLSPSALIISILRYQTKLTEALLLNGERSSQATHTISLNADVLSYTITKDGAGIELIPNQAASSQAINMLLSYTQDCIIERNLLREKLEKALPIRNARVRNFNALHAAVLANNIHVMPSLLIHPALIHNPCTIGTSKNQRQVTAEDLAKIIGYTHLIPLLRSARLESYTPSSVHNLFYNRLQSESMMAESKSQLDTHSPS